MATLHRCGAPTQNGSPCARRVGIGIRCHHHTNINGPILGTDASRRNRSETKSHSSNPRKKSKTRSKSSTDVPPPPPMPELPPSECSDSPSVVDSFLRSAAHDLSKMYAQVSNSLNQSKPVVTSKGLDQAQIDSLTTQIQEMSLQITKLQRSCNKKPQIDVTALRLYVQNNQRFNNQMLRWIEQGRQES
ncbi:hypothetical protein DAPPUDRAFT_344135 [Daphnia pulex]|uniref:Uncharacterized protein n=1 Tax=Daphnia pulex TaxID=6669 RepID=E9I6K6_DAPPU|nr:hypothetical protein DAPPUDRAFT_344135 [Daphnia pulex]|eukprot:EFX60374.1 hypothetical protein DAPPUDRAFT_344135 [Daphnia pulex]